MRRSLYAAAVAATLTVSVAACGADEATVVAADATHEPAPSTKPVVIKPPPDDGWACGQYQVTTPDYGRDPSAPVQRSTLADVTSEILERRPGKYTLRRVDVDSAVLRMHGAKRRSATDLERDSVYGWTVTQVMKVRADCPSTPLDAEFAKPGTPLRPSKGSSKHDGDPGADGKAGDGGDGGEGGEGGNARVGKNTASKAAKPNCVTEKRISDYASGMRGRPTVAEAIPPRKGKPGSLTVRYVDDGRAIVRERRGNDLTVYRITRTPSGGWLKHSETSGDIRCPGYLAEENALPGKPIERA